MKKTDLQVDGLICCRGESLRVYKKLKEENYDFITLINEFNRFIVEDSELLSFLKHQSSTAFLTQQININCSGVDQNLLNQINVREITITRFKSIGDLPPMVKKREGWKERTRFRVFRRKITKQPESLVPYLEYVENSLHIAILNMIVVKKCTAITIIGSDFYEADYYLSHKEPDWEQTSTKKTQDKLKKGMDCLISKFPDVQFNLFTCSTYNNNLKNCKIVKICP